MKPLPAVLAVALLTGCGVPKEKFEALQKDLDAEKSRTAALTTQLALATNATATASAKADAVQSQLFAAAREVTSLKEQLTRAESQRAALEEQLNQAQSQNASLAPLAKKARTLPVTISRRNALTGSGLVYKFNNQTDSLLRVSVTITGGTTRKTFDLVLEPASAKRATEIGHLEGWTGAPGDIIEVNSTGFDTLTKTVP